MRAQKKNSFKPPLKKQKREEPNTYASSSTTTTTPVEVPPAVTTESEVQAVVGIASSIPVLTRQVEEVPAVPPVQLPPPTSTAISITTTESEVRSVAVNNNGIITGKTKNEFTTKPNTKTTTTNYSKLPTFSNEDLDNLDVSSGDNFLKDVDAGLFFNSVPTIYVAQKEDKFTTPSTPAEKLPNEAGDPTPPLALSTSSTFITNTSVPIIQDSIVQLSTTMTDIEALKCPYCFQAFHGASSFKVHVTSHLKVGLEAIIAVEGQPDTAILSGMAALLEDPIGVATAYGTFINIYEKKRQRSADEIF